jgi:hypothetical protein
VKTAGGPRIDPPPVLSVLLTFPFPFYSGLTSPVLSTFPPLDKLKFRLRKMFRPRYQQLYLGRLAPTFCKPIPAINV